ncbi:hypothetical protein LAX5112_03298 [Roseibium alexandrii]|uniref:Uncharacterized protein n=1 Tax=Roseibium alexandrii TaxID=388408 RepID=A0A0M7AEC4_9HYPH|nr:hypothetical protein LAX5112_03298 [Roseibium alexandrii]
METAEKNRKDSQNRVLNFESLSESLPQIWLLLTNAPFL